MKKILVIEEDTSLLKAYQAMFKSDEFSVVGAATGQEGLTLVQLEKPDVILLDIMLPGGINGFDVLERLKANPATKATPVVILTNLESEEKVAKKIGAEEYFIKANTPAAEVVRRVKELVR